jgi:hypothetical protein
MLLKPRYFLVSCGLGILLSVILFSYYAVPILPPDLIEQRRQSQKLSPEAQLLIYYRQYPDRYIRVSKESWQYDQSSRSAFHSFTLKNTAGVAYYAIEVLVSYQRSDGKILYTQAVKIPGTLAPYGTLEVKKITVKHVPAASESVLIGVAKALITQ